MFSLKLWNSAIRVASILDLPNMATSGIIELVCQQIVKCLGHIQLLSKAQRFAMKWTVNLHDWSYPTTNWYCGKPVPHTNVIQPWKQRHEKRTRQYIKTSCNVFNIKKSNDIFHFIITKCRGIMMCAEAFNLAIYKNVLIYGKPYLYLIELGYM
jgi:hypothetical protein